MTNDTSSSNNNFIVLVVCLILRLERPRISYLSTLFFDTGLINLEISNLVQTVIGNDSQPYEDNWISIKDHPLSIS